jgi:hypothetical protein
MILFLKKLILGYFSPIRSNSSDFMSLTGSMAKERMSAQSKQIQE